ncbi:MAG: minichromosome maintenance protein MCM [Acidilobaceae archaeon]|nr:minichromosome maintenance protein MCM [Acidilobaceae archaeon]
MGKEIAAIAYGDAFREFVSSFRDESGSLKYKERLMRMLNFGARSLVIEFGDLYRYDVALAEDLVDKPGVVLKAFSEELARLAGDQKRYKVRVVGLYEVTKIRNVRSEHVGKLVEIEGIVTRMHPHKSKLLKAYFRHDRCGGEFQWPPGDEEVGERVDRPTVCPVCGEGGGRFILMRERSLLVDWQKIVVQEKPEDVPGGQMPRSIPVHLTEDLVDSVRPGDRVSITGIVRLYDEDSRSPYQDLYVEAVGVRASERALEEVVITREDEEKILELKSDPWIKEKIISSIAPGIYGYWNLKEAIALLLFGGQPKVLKDETRIRGDIHVLFLGDPGVAKSQLLQAASRIAPRAVFTTGKGSTAAGLTAAVVRDSRTGEFFLEAGALVLADGGVAVIDEIDKMDPKDRVAIHEAMEQQQVSISKAGIVARLSARASVLAAGNPKLGLYDPNRSFVDNVNLPPTILSRFDLIFVIRDTINIERDRKLVKHILGVHAEPERAKPEIEPELLKKYIIYARRYVRPKLTPAASQLLEEFFVEVRSAALHHQEGGQAPVPITARQLESLVRLAEAHARMALREEVTEEDAAAAIRLMTEYLTSVGMDVESGVVDVSTIMTGTGFTTRRLMAEVLDLIKRGSTEGKCVKLEDIVAEMSKRNVERRKVEEVVSKMNREGIIYDKGNGCYMAV